MFYYASKIVWLFLTPSNLIFTGLAVGMLLCLLRGPLRRFGRGLIAASLFFLVLCGFGPAGRWLGRPLETRFARSSDTSPPAGIIVLGGAVKNKSPLADPEMAETNESGERFTALLLLARRYPNARLVFSGGSGELLDSGTPEADEVKARIGAFGLDPARMLFEDGSRTTYENAVFTKAMVAPKPGERWLLVTSAWHMPRSIGCFRKAGFDVEPFPVDFRSSYQNDLRPFNAMSAGLALTDLTAHEWLGLAAYWLTDKTDALLPGP